MSLFSNTPTHLPEEPKKRLPKRERILHQIFLAVKDQKVVVVNVTIREELDPRLRGDDNGGRLLCDQLGGFLASRQHSCRLSLGMTESAGRVGDIERTVMPRGLSGYRV